MGHFITETETVIKRILPYLTRRGYDLDKDLSFETAIQSNTRYSKGYVDILVTCGKKEPLFLIEAKRASKNLSSKDRDQAIDYGESLKVFFVVVTNGTDIQVFNTKTHQAIRWDGKLTDKIPSRSQITSVISQLKKDQNLTDISLSNDKKLPYRPGLPLKQLNELFKRCHNHIRKIEKNEEHAFGDFSKILFLKLLEEKYDIEERDLPYSYRFYEMAQRPKQEADQVKGAIEDMLRTIQSEPHYRNVIQDRFFLKKPQSFFYIVEQLSKVSFSDSTVDSKGAAFEYYVRATLKGKKLGQYFTPRPLIEIMLCLVGREKISSALLAGSTLKVLDPACGTGGFLVYLLEDTLKNIENAYQSRRITKTTRDDLIEKAKRQTFYGSDANEDVAAAAKMNMIVAGDGHTNIKAEDSLSKNSVNWHGDEALSDCDIILTNPPFGTSESDSLSVVELADYPVSSKKGQHLFLQKMVLATKIDHEICSVIDEGVLNTATSQELRKWLLQRCDLLCIVRLPEETFKPNKINVRASLIYLRKKANNDVDLQDNYKVTFCDLGSLGYEGSGDSIRGFDFSKLKDDVSQRILNQGIGTIRKGEHWMAYDVDVQDIIHDGSFRFDVKYWEPCLRDKLAQLQERQTTKTIKELNTILTLRGYSPSSSLYVDKNEGYALVVKAGSNIDKFGNLVDDGDFLEKNIFDEMEVHHLKKGDILLSSTGDGTLGKCCVFRSDLPAIADGHVTVIRVNPKEIYPEYLCDYLRCGFGAEQIQRLYTGSTGLIELTPSQVESILVDISLDKDEQKRKSNALRNSEKQYAKKIQKADEDLLYSRLEFSNNNED